jgi:hypothetical protein
VQQFGRLNPRLLNLRVMEKKAAVMGDFQNAKLLCSQANDVSTVFEDQTRALLVMRMHEKWRQMRLAHRRAIESIEQQFDRDLDEIEVQRERDVAVIDGTLSVLQKKRKRAPVGKGKVVAGRPVARCVTPLTDRRMKQYRQGMGAELNVPPLDIEDLRFARV